MKHNEFSAAVKDVANTPQGAVMLRELYKVTGIHDPIIVTGADRCVDPLQMMINTGMQRAYLFIRQHLTQEQISKIEVRGV